MSTHIIDDQFLAPVHLAAASNAEIDTSIERLIVAIETNSEAQLDNYCDGAELDRERSAYEPFELDYQFELLALRTKELECEASCFAYLLARTVAEQRKRRAWGVCRMCGDDIPAWATECTPCHEVRQRAEQPW